MEAKVKIRISETAYNKLLDLLKNEKDYSFTRFSYSSGCCRSSKVEITLDCLKPDDIQDKIDELPIVYNRELFENIKSITLIYKNSSFMAKTEQRASNKNRCGSCSSSCHKGCGSCN